MASPDLGSWLPGDYFFCDYSGPRRMPARSDQSIPKDGKPRAHILKNLPEPVKKPLKAVRDTFHEIAIITKLVIAGVHVARENNPTHIIGVSDDGPALLSSYIIARLTSTSHVLWLFDIYLGNNLTFFEKALSKVFEPRMFKSAKLVIVTNEATRDLYRKRYGSGFKCAVIPNSISLSKYEENRTPYKPTKPHNIVYTGNVYWAQERSLLRLVRLMKELEDQQIFLKLYVPFTNDAFLGSLHDHPNIILASAHNTQMPEIQCNSTILFLPLSWNTQNPEVIATASPGKFTDYLASGRPMLIFAPPYAFISQYAKRKKLAHVVEEENEIKLKAGLLKLIQDQKYSHHLINQALATLRIQHDAQRNGKIVMKLLGVSK
jgi:hypothetical protein